MLAVTVIGYFQQTSPHFLIKITFRKRGYDLEIDANSSYKFV